MEFKFKYYLFLFEFFLNIYFYLFIHLFHFFGEGSDQQENGEFARDLEVESSCGIIMIFCSKKKC